MLVMIDATSKISANSFYPALRGAGLVNIAFTPKSMHEFDLHEIRMPSPQSVRLGPLYMTQDEMRYGPRRVDQAGLERVHTALADRQDLSIPPVALQ